MNVKYVRDFNEVAIIILIEFGALYTVSSSPLSTWMVFSVELFSLLSLLTPLNNILRC